LDLQAFSLPEIDWKDISSSPEYPLFTVNSCHEDLPYTIEWEQLKLGDEVRIVMGQSPNSENYTDDPNGR